MEYNLLIYAGSKTLSAFNVNDSHSEYISMDGNTSCSVNEIESFYENLLDYYNVDDLSELRTGVQIINGGTTEKNIRVLTEHFAKLLDYNVWTVKKVLPIILMERNYIDKNSSIVVQVYDETYLVRTDTGFNFFIEETNVTPDLVLKLENFTVMNHFNGTNFHGDEEETKRFKRLIEELKTNNKDLNEECASLRSKLTLLERNRVALLNVIGNADVKAKLKGFVDKEINLSAYEIQTEMEESSRKMRISVQNKKSDQSYCFAISVDISGTYTKDRFQHDLYKKIARAIVILNENDGYNQLKNSQYAALKKGDTFEFGRYGGKPLKWIVLNKSDSSLFVISEDLICQRRFDPSSNKWKNSELREWLNKDFYGEAFNTGEKSFIGNVEGDKVTLLTYEEANKLLTKEQRAKGFKWWLRSPGDRSNDATYVNATGSICGHDLPADIVDSEAAVSDALNSIFREVNREFSRSNVNGFAANVNGFATNMVNSYMGAVSNALDGEGDFVRPAFSLNL